MEEFNNNNMNMKKKWSPRKPKAGRHIKKAAVIAASVAVVGLLEPIVPIRFRNRSRRYCLRWVFQKR